MRFRSLLCFLLPVLLATTAPPVLAGGKQRLVLNFLGGGVGYQQQVPTLDPNDGDETVMANCFDAEVFDLSTGQWAGNATDCLQVVDGDPMTGLQVVGTTYFRLLGGEFALQGRTSARPVTWSPAETAGFTHVTGSNGSGGPNVIFGGTGRFRNVVGTARLSGLIDLSQAGASNIIDFDCVFIIDLERASRSGGARGNGRAR